jgi:hypothetical protein
VGLEIKVKLENCSDALVDHGPWTSVAILVCESIGGPISDVVVLATAYEDRQQRSVGFSLRATLRAHSPESVGYLGKLMFEDGVELSLGHAFSEHIYSFREGLADFLILLQAFDHHGGEIRDQLFVASVLLS